MGKIEIQQTKNDLGYTFNGFDETFPRELMGIIPVKEYIRAIEILNSNCRRTHVSYWYLLGSYYFINIGVIPIIVILIVEMVRWSRFVKSLRKDHDLCCDIINQTMTLRGVKFKVEISSKPIGKIIITIPDIQPISPNETVQLEGSNVALLLPPFPDARAILNPGLYHDSDAPLDVNYKHIVVKCKKSGYFSLGFEGFYNEYDFGKLYNYISHDEYKEMIGDFNKNLICDYSEKFKIFHKITFILMLILVGIILAIPYFIWLYIERGPLLKKFENKSNELKLKYNNLYSSRGISISIKNNIPDSLNSYYLIITFPADCGNAPVVAKISNSTQLVLAPTLPGGIAPYYQVMNQV